MPRINLEEKWFSDPRRLSLICKLGSEVRADGVMVLAIKLAQQYWIPNKELIPEKSWKGVEIPDELIQVGLAEKRGNHYYISGSEEHFEWWFKKQESGRMGGLARASNAKQRQAQSSSAKHSQAQSSMVKQAQPSSSSSSSSSSSNPKYIYSHFVEEWNSHQIITHDINKINKQLLEKKINKKLETYTGDEIKQAMKNYKLALSSGKFTYTWGLIDFLGRENALKFYPDNFVERNYLTEQEANRAKLQRDFNSAPIIGEPSHD